jgi:branched-chain amino acid transport system ATP-binding protein
LYLEAKDITVLYDRATVVNGVSLQIRAGEMISLVGPNGAGKTTFLKALAGVIKWEIDTLKGTTHGKITLTGSVMFQNEELLHRPAHKIAREGLILCPERGRPFKELTVERNLEAGAYLVKNKAKIEESKEKIFNLFPRLKERRSQMSGTLSGGERTMLAIGRALMSRAKLLLIDEPSTGLAPLIKKDLFEKIRDVHEMGITILLVEQDIGFAFNLADRNYVMSQGKIIAEGSSEELLSDDIIRTTYLGL